MSYKTVSGIVLGIAASASAFILFSKKNEQPLIIPIHEIARNELKKAAQPESFTGSAANVTGDVARAIADELLSRNPQGPQADAATGIESISALDPQLLAERILQEQVQKITTEVFSAIPSPNELHISQNTSAARYLVEHGRIIRAAQTRLAPYAGKPFDDTTVRAMNEAAAQTIAQLKQLAVPIELVGIHAEHIQLLSAQYAITKNILQRESDPVAAAISISLIDKVDQQLSALGEKIKAYLVQNPS